MFAVKPSNIMLTESDGRFICKLIDFSISAVEEAARADVSNTMRTGTTSLGAQTGTPHCEPRAAPVVSELLSLGLTL